MYVRKSLGGVHNGKECDQPDEDEGSVHIKERRTSFDVKI